MARLRAIHLLTNPNEQREIRSIGEVSLLGCFGIEYIQSINPPHSGELPPARECNDRPFALTKGHYGCYLAHKNAMELYLNDVDALLIFECDALFTEGVEKFRKRIQQAYEACLKFDLLMFTFGPKHGGKTLKRLTPNIVTTSRFIETHAYMVPLKSKEILSEMFAKPWDALDYCYCIYLFDQDHHRIGIFSDRPASVQGNGMSLVDNKMKTSEHHFRFIRSQL